MQSANRKEEIMYALVKDYIENNSAISSSALVKKTNLNISSATMRNELALLEEEGYVQNLHTSSGRIPTDKGYRYFVDKLMNSVAISTKERTFLHGSINEMSSSICSILSHTACILAELSQSPVIVVTENYRKNIIKFIQLVLLNVHQVMVVILNNYGENFEEIVSIEEIDITQIELNKITEYLNNIYKDSPVEDIEDMLSENKQKVMHLFSAYEQILNKVRSAIKKSAKKLSSRNAIVENKNMLLSIPEFQEIETLKKINSIIEDESKLLSVFDQFDNLKGNDRKVQTRIGAEHFLEELSDTSLIYSDVNLEGECFANIGILGPTRMRYEKNFSRMSYITDLLKEKIHNLFM